MIFKGVLFLMTFLLKRNDSRDYGKSKKIHGKNHHGYTGIRTNIPVPKFTVTPHVQYSKAAQNTAKTDDDSED